MLAALSLLLPALHCSVISSACVVALHLFLFSFFFTDPAPNKIYTLSLHDALPISRAGAAALGAPAPPGACRRCGTRSRARRQRSEEHTSELQSLRHLVCRLLLEKKKSTRG